MNGYEELAKLFKERENSDEYSPIFGEIMFLPETMIKINNYVILSEKDFDKTFDINAVDENGAHIYDGKTVVLLPYRKMQKFIAIGVLL